MRNPTSACPGLPDAARGTSQRSRNCPQSGPPCPQNGSCWTRRIVSAADGFEADSFPKIKKLEQKLGVQSNRRSSARPEGPSPRRETFAQPRHSRSPTSSFPHSPHVIPAQAGIQGGGAVRAIPPSQPPPQIQSNRQPHAEATAATPKANNRPFSTFQLQKARKNPQLSSEAKHSNQAPRAALGSRSRRPLHNRHSRTSPAVMPAKTGTQGGGAERGIPHHSPRPNPRPQSRRAATGNPGWGPRLVGSAHPPNLVLHGELRTGLLSRE